MDGWNKIGDDRWEYVQDDEGADGSRNYLLRDGEVLTEMHVSGNRATFHRYRGEIIDDTAPLTGVTWWRSEELVLAAAVGPDQAWQMLAGYVG